MIKVYIEDSGIKCETSHDAKINEKHFPLKFVITELVSNKPIWESELNLGMWAKWNGMRDINAKVITKDGIILKEFNYDYTNENLDLYEFWDYFCRINKTSIGLILGCGTGTWGEWVIPVHREKIRCHLVEGTEKTFEELKKIYGENKQFKIYNHIITAKGGNCTFYECEPYNEFNTTNYDYLKKIPNNSKLEPKSKLSKSINVLLDEIGAIDWIRIDLEGIDYEIITTIPKDKLNSLKMLQYEHLNLDAEKAQQIDVVMSELNFKKLVYNIDTIYFK